jgi:hypothetical protein
MTGAAQGRPSGEPVSLELLSHRTTAAADSARPKERADAALPAAPRSVVDTGVPQRLLVELGAKILLLRRQERLAEFAHHLRLPLGVANELLEWMRAERLVERLHGAASGANALYALTDSGRDRATEFLHRCRYAGAAPVPVESYVAQAQRQSVGRMRVKRADVEGAYQGLVVPAPLRDQIGIALNSGRPLFFYGPAGSGKTWLAESLVRLLKGCVAVPYAILVDGEIVKLFDPLVHRPIAERSREWLDAPGLDARGRTDPRWVLCERPVVRVGGELRLDMLELSFDSDAGFYQAPPHVKANNGLLLIDDLGRQLVTPEQLLNRWIVPLDRGRDYLTLHTGTSFELPFDLVLVFATNLDPQDIADEAFLRRLGCRIYVGPVEEDDYRAIMQAVCEELGVVYQERAFRALLKLHQRDSRPTLACYPHDLIRLVIDAAAYAGHGSVELTSEAIEDAWDRYTTL